MLDINKFYELIQYIILGIVQGLTEPLPISSSGHVLIFREIFSVQISGLTFEIIVNFGSLLAIMFVYRESIYQLTKNFFIYLLFRKSAAKRDFNYTLLIILATIPIGVVGLLTRHWIETSLSSLLFVGLSLLLTGFFLWLIRHLKGFKSDYQISWRDALIIGFVQIIALVPGVSRSGATIVAAMLVGLKRETALRFSFLLYIPVSLGVTILSIDEITQTTQSNSMIIPLVIAWITAIIATYIALKWFVQVMLRGKLVYFTYYCVGIGSVLIVNHFLF